MEFCFGRLNEFGAAGQRSGYRENKPGQSCNQRLDSGPPPAIVAGRWKQSVLLAASAFQVQQCAFHCAWRLNDLAVGKLSPAMIEDNRLREINRVANGDFRR